MSGTLSQLFHHVTSSSMPLNAVDRRWMLALGPISHTVDGLSQGHNERSPDGKQLQTVPKIPYRLRLDSSERQPLHKLRASWESMVSRVQTCQRVFSSNSLRSTPQVSCGNPRINLTTLTLWTHDRASLMCSIILVELSTPLQIQGL